MRKIISTFLAIVMILSVLTVPIYAEAVHGENITESIGVPDQNKEITQQAPSVLPLPAIVSREEALREGYIGRVKEEEKNLYTLVFDKGNGQNTMKIYSHPVKYIDSFGKVKDIGLDVKEFSDGSFKSANHEIITTFRKNISDGISLEYEDINIKMVPDIKSSRASKAVSSADNTVVSYALDAKTSYVYELTYSGFKEDIVVSEYTGQTEYEFTLYTNGLTLVKENGSYYLKDSADNIKATIGEVIIFTADERNNTFGSMTHETVRAAQEYKITIHVDEDYLRDEKTLYPIRIDPTVEVKYATNGAGAIEDVTLNSLAGSSATSTALMAGLRSSYGIGRILIKAPALSFENIPSAESITSASVSIRDIMCESTPIQISCHRFTGREWSEGSVSWSNANPNSYDSTPLDTKTVSYSIGTSIGHRYSFNITSAVKLWYGSTSAKNMGLIFKAPDSLENGSVYQCKTFGSYNNSTYRPVITVNYEYDAEISISTSQSVAEGDTVTIPATVTPSNLAITWTSSDTSIATVDSNGTVTGVKAGSTVITATVYGSDGNPVSVYCAVNVRVANGVYYIKNVSSALHLAANNGGIQENTDVIHTIPCTGSDSAITRLSQMWRIQHLEGDKYSIRPLHKLDMGLNVTGSNIDIVSIGTTDTASAIPNTAEWAIQYTSMGYVLKNQNNSQKTLQLSTQTVAVSESIISAADGQNDYCRWQLIKIPDPPSGILLYDRSTGSVVTNPTRYVAKGETRSLGHMNFTLSSYPGINQSFTWTSSSPSVATVNGTTGEVTGVSNGTTTITGTNSYGSVSISVEVISIHEGTYFLRNKQVGYYADIEGPTMANGTEIHQWTFNGNNSQRWIFDYIGNGYYTIRSANSNGAYYLGVEGDANVKNSNIVLRTGTITDGMKWAVSVTSSGAYRLTPKTGDWCLATNTSDQTNGVKLIAGEYVYNNSYRDEWLLTRIQYSATVYNYYDKGYCVRYGETETASVSKINSYINAVSKQYLKLLGLEITAPTAMYYGSAIDACKGTVNSGNIDTLCSHTDPHTILFNTTNSVSNHFNNNTFPAGSNVITKAYWSGHRIKSYSNVEDEYNRCYSSGTSIYMLALIESSSRDLYSIGILMHELNHQYGAPDHYHEILDEGTVNERCRGGDLCYDCGSNARPESCVMSHSRIDITAPTVICEGCKSDIYAHLENHH